MAQEDSAADEDDADEPAVETTEPPKVAQPPANAAPAPGADNPLVAPSENSTDLDAHWRKRHDYLRERDERRAEDEEARVLHLKDELAIENLFGIAGGLVRENREALGNGTPHQARAHCQLAVALAPGLPQAHACLARAVWADDRRQWSLAVDEALESSRVALADPRVSRSLAADAAVVVLSGLFAGAAAFLLLLFVRNARLFVHDVHHLFPKGARRWQTGMLTAVLVLLPLLLQIGPLPALLLVVCGAAIYLSRAETVLALVALLLFAAVPFAAQGVATLSAYSGPAADAWLVEHGDAPRQAVERLRVRLETPGLPGEAAVAFVLGHKAKREGAYAEAGKLYRRSLDAARGAEISALSALHNDLGNALMLSGSRAEAMVQYQQAIDLQPTSGSAHFNLGRALGLGSLEELDKAEAEQSKALQYDRPGIEAFTKGQRAVNRHANQFLIDLPMPDSLFEPLLAEQQAAVGPVGAEVRDLLAAPLPGAAAWLLPALAALGLLILQVARDRLKPSGRCERCGREVCKRCDRDARPAEGLCAQCVNVFIRRINVEPAERLRKELAVQRYRRRRRAWSRVVALLCGAGHVLLGYPVVGLFFMTTAAWLVAGVALWGRTVRDPYGVRPGPPAVEYTAVLVVLALVMLACLRDLILRQRAEDG